MSGIIAILIANIIWGAAPPIFKFALTDIPPFTLAFIRFFIGGLFFIPFMIHTKSKLKGKYLMHIVLGGIWGISINVAFFFLGLNLAPSINVHIIGSLGPLVLYMLSLIILKEKPHPQIIKGMFICLIGAAFIVFAPIIKAGIMHDSTYPISSYILGNVFFILSMLGGVLMIIHTKKVSGKVDVFTITGIQFFVGALCFLPFMISELKTWSFSELTDSSWVGILYGIIFSSVIAYFAHTYAITKISAQQIGVFSYIMPVIAVLVAIPLLHEYPDVFFIIGSIFVFIGMFISERHPHMQKIHKKLHKEG
jgi:drug/metabolite transporter (DMT)-like permease